MPNCDVHIHLYPPNVYNDPAKWAAERKETYWLQCVAPSNGPRLQGWADLDTLIRNMDTAGVEKAIVVGWYWERSEVCLENISWQQDWLERSPDRLMAFAPFNANGGREAIESIKRAFDLGFSGIGELNPPAQGYTYDHGSLLDAIALAGSRGKWVNFHVTDPDTRDYPGKIDTPIDQLMDLASGFPDTRFIFSHLGGMMQLDRIAESANVYLDTAAIPLLYDSNIYKSVVEQMGAERILFGSDYPLKTFPKTQTEPEFVSHIDQIRNSSLSDQDKALILGGNFSRLFDSGQFANSISILA